MKYVKILAALSIFCLLAFLAQAQTLTIEFPKFAGKTFDFIIFQGDISVKLYENDTIPEDGLVKVVIPKEYAPYTGMCRWLITNTKEGGGLDMAIPGFGFKVSCMSDKPDESNIRWVGYDAVNELNRLNLEQQTIISKYETVGKAAQLYGKEHPLYLTFVKEKRLQAATYDRFVLDLKMNPNYNARFLPIVNLVKGIAPRLTDDNEERLRLVNNYIITQLNYDDLYTSGHWSSVIQSWVQIHAQVLGNKDSFLRDFTVISRRITEPKKFTEWVGRITHSLTLYGKDDFIAAIAPTVINSGKITSYDGNTMQVYVKAMVGNIAPDLVLTMPDSESCKETFQRKQSLKSDVFVQEGFKKCLLVFYRSGCGPCEELMRQLPAKYAWLKEKGTDVISISADETEYLFQNSSKEHPWPRKYCDFKSLEGVNFKNYAVSGTPTIFLVDKSGTIESRMATIDEVIAKIK